MRSMTAVMTDAQERNPWDRMPDEPFDWHARFQICCNRGPSHSLSCAGPADVVGKVRAYFNVEHVRRRPRKRRKK